MKTLTAIFFCLAAIFEGCSTTNTITGEERTQVLKNPDSDVIVTLQDGREIEAQSYRYVEVDDSSDIVVGKGDCYDSASAQFKPCQGPFYGSSPKWVSVDTVLTTGWSTRTPVRQTFAMFQGDRGSAVRFLKDDYLPVTKHDGTGLRIHGTESGKAFDGIIDPRKIKNVRQVQFSWVKTSLLATGVAATIVLSAFAIALSNLNFQIPIF